MARFGDVLEVDSHAFRPVLGPGGRQRLELAWTVRGPAVPGLHQFAHVVRPDGRGGNDVWALEDTNPYPSATWRGGERGLSWFELQLPDAAPTGAYWISTGLYLAPGLARVPIYDAASRPAGDSLTLGPFKVWSPDNVTPPPIALATFDGGILIAGVEAPAVATRGGSVPVRLRWWAPGPTARPLTVFVHLVGRDRRQVAGADGPPAAGSNPTSVWQPGETIVDERALALPADLPPGPYTVEIGLYDPSSGARLPLRRADERVGDAAILARVDVR
jgi:hypothetical protein